MLTEKQVLELRDSLNSKGYCQINNFISSDLKDYLQATSQLFFHTLNSFNLGRNDEEWIIPPKSNAPKGHIYYSPVFGESFLMYLAPIYSKIVNKSLIPTYSFIRKYFKGNYLPPHSDRPSCQYSATIQLDASKINEKWPITMGKDECFSGLGDIVLYKGEEVEHSREPLKLNYSTHLFLHFVDKNDKNYKKYWFDEREMLNFPQKTSK